MSKLAFHKRVREEYDPVHGEFKQRARAVPHTLQLVEEGGRGAGDNRETAIGGQGHTFP